MIIANDLIVMNCWIVSSERPADECVAQPGCPLMCRCNDGIVDCRDKSLTDIPAYLPETATELWVSTTSHCISSLLSSVWDVTGAIFFFFLFFHLSKKIHCLIKLCLKVKNLLFKVKICRKFVFQGQNLSKICLVSSKFVENFPFKVKICRKFVENFLFKAKFVENFAV